MAATYIVYFPLGETVPQRLKCDFAAASAPTGSDTKAAGGWTKGSLWYLPSTDTLYICEDETVATWKQVGGGGGSLHTDASVSGAHDIDRDDGETHDLTLTGNATFTISGAFTGDVTDLRLMLRQDGTGSRTVTWPGSVTWIGGSAPTLQTGANAFDVIGLFTVDDGTTWIGAHIDSSGGGASDHGALTGLSDDDHPQYVKDSEFTAEDDVLVGTGSGTFDARPSGRHYHVVGETLTFDGTATVYYLANLAEELTVAAYDSDGDRVGITHDSSELDKITFDAAPAAGTGWVDYVAALN